jgi:S1-C subfamily serine protease
MTLRSKDLAGLVSCASIAVALNPISPLVAQTGDIASQISAEYSTATLFLAVHGTNSEGLIQNNVGSGFVISTEGYVITAAHVVLDSKQRPFTKVLVRGSLGASFDPEATTGLILPLEVIRTNTDVDVALLKLPYAYGANAAGSTKYNSVHFCQGHNIPVGSRIHALGFPLGQPLSVNSGTLSSKDGPRGLWKTDISVNVGSSGGPVFDNSGHVIGVVKGGIQEAPGNNYFVPVNLFFDVVQTGLASIDDCTAATAELQPLDCSPKLVDIDIDIAKSDHPSFSPDSRPFTKTFHAIPGYKIDSVRWVAASQSKATEPEIAISPDGESLRFEANVTSGPFFDQWRGWISGKLITTQKPKCEHN